jgi:ABC-type nitrate/sulfonate/bicarbonate transport system permease component
VKIRAATVQNWIIPVTGLVAWEVCGRMGVAPRYLSTPGMILAALLDLALSGELFVGLAASLYRVVVGFAIGAIAGVLAGLGAGMSPGVRNFFDPLVSALFAVPKVAFLPVFLLLFGLGHASKISIIAFSSFFPVFLASRQAILSISPIYVWAAKNMGASRTTIFFHVVIPAAAPQLFSGIRIGVAHAYVVLFAAEVIGSQSGLGTIISEGEDAARFDIMLAGIACFAIVGFASDRLLMKMRRHILRGQMIGTQEEASR